MTTINAWQHIFSNVEKERSPQGRGGFQTLFYTRHGLVENEVEEMESYLLYFPSEVEPVKRLFFTISGGKGVAAQIVFLPNPDQYGRGGRYLAHSLIFAPEALAQFEADPFRVFRQFSFITTVEEALAQGNFQTGDIPAVSLNLPPTLAGDVDAARVWPATELKKLVLLALRAKQQAQEREAITFVGAPEQIEPALEAAFLAVPVAERTQCSFDTYFYRCNLVATYFWGIGLPEPPASIKFTQVDGQSKQVQGDITPQPETAYERWVIKTIDDDNLEHIAKQREQAFALAAWLEGKSYNLDLLTAAPNTLISEMLTINRDTAHTLLRSQVNKKLPDALVNRAAEQLFARASGLDLYRQLRQGFETHALLETLYQSYAAEQFKAPSRQEIKALAELLETTHHGQLNLFLACWTHPRKVLPKALGRAADQDYRAFVKTALSSGLQEPLVLLVPGQGDAFLDLYLAKPPDDVVELSEVLLETGEGQCLARLTPYISHLPGKQVKKLAKLAEDQTGLPDSFTQALETALEKEAQKKGKGILGFIWPGSSKKD